MCIRDRPSTGWASSGPEPSARACPGWPSRAYSKGTSERRAAPPAPSRVGATMSDGEAGVDPYLAVLADDAARRALSDLRARIGALVPDATDRIAYQVPAFFQGGALVSYGARPKHCSLFVQSPALVARLADQLAECDVQGATIHFTPERPLSDRVLELVVRERLAENAARHGG